MEDGWLQSIKSPLVRVTMRRRIMPLRGPARQDSSKSRIRCFGYPDHFGANEQIDRMT